MVFLFSFSWKYFEVNKIEKELKSRKEQRKIKKLEKKALRTRDRTEHVEREKVGKEKVKTLRKKKSE